MIQNSDTLLSFILLLKSIGGALLLGAFVILFCRCSGEKTSPWQRWARINHEPLRFSDSIVDHYPLKGEKEKCRQ